MIRLMMCIALLLAIFGYTAEQVASNSQTSPENNATQYWLVLLKKGTNWEDDTLSTQEILKAHQVITDRINASGNLVMSGPVTTEGELLGIIILKGKDAVSVTQLVNQDQRIKAGTFQSEIQQWQGTKADPISH